MEQYADAVARGDPTGLRGGCPNGEWTADDQMEFAINVERRAHPDDYDIYGSRIPFMGGDVDTGEDGGNPSGGYWDRGGAVAPDDLHLSGGGGPQTSIPPGILQTWFAGPIVIDDAQRHIDPVVDQLVRDLVPAQPLPPAQARADFWTDYAARIKRADFP